MAEPFQWCPLACYSSKMTTCKNLSAVVEEKEAPTFTDNMNRHTYLHQDPMGVWTSESHYDHLSILD